MIKNRKLNRLKDYDYTQEGYYFVTICTRDRKEWFGKIKGGAIGILSIVGNGRDRSLRHNKIKSLSELIGAFKTTSSKLIHRTGLSEIQWQKSFHDHIIRGEGDLTRIREYIINNPLQWEEDAENVHKA